MYLGTFLRSVVGRWYIRGSLDPYDTYLTEGAVSDRVKGLCKKL